MLPSHPPANGKAVDLKGDRVLVVDDESDAREVIARLLRRANAQVETAGSAEEAKRIATSGPMC